MVRRSAARRGCALPRCSSRRNCALPAFPQLPTCRLCRANCPAGVKPAVLIAAALVVVVLFWRRQARYDGGSSLVLAELAAPQAAYSAVNLNLAHHLLALTNLSAVSTAVLLDAAGPGLSSAQTRELVQLHQTLYCRCRPGWIGRTRWLSFAVQLGN